MIDVVDEILVELFVLSLHQFTDVVELKRCFVEQKHGGLLLPVLIFEFALDGGEFHIMIIVQHSYEFHVLVPAFPSLTI